LGGLVKVETRTLPDGTHGYAAADFIDASGMLSFQPTKRVKVGLAGRRSYLDQSLSSVSSSDVQDFVPIPRYYDAQGQLMLSFSKDEDVTFIGLTSDDRLKRSIASDDPATVPAE